MTKTYLANKDIGYEGNVSGKALPLSWDQMMPALPPQKHAGCEEIANFGRYDDQIAGGSGTLLEAGLEFLAMDQAR